MNRFINPAYPLQHRGAERFTSALFAFHGFGAAMRIGRPALGTLLLAGAVAAVVVVADQIERRAPVDVEWLECGRPFSSIHMASAGYFELRRSETRTNSARAAECAQLRRAGVIEVRAELYSATPSKQGRLDGKGNFDGTQ